jgi:hypothetical protein
VISIGRYVGKVERGPLEGRTGQEHTPDISTRREESSLAGEDGESGVGMLIQYAQGIYRLWYHLAAEGIERLGSVELD